MANYTSTHTGAVIDAAVTKITATSSSATELNLLDGVTATTAEINILDGVTSTAAEINILDGVTSTTAEINLLDGVTATTTELNLIDGVTATTAEINYIDGVTSNIQTQLNLKAPLAGASLTGTTSFQNLSDGTITITAFADEDNMSSNSATLLATQQSIKAYVDAEVSDNNFTTTLKNKLDAIEASATADQSNAEIRTAVEAATDSNVFTDADHSKLNAIEASATADQSNAEIVAAVEAGSDSNTFTDADHSKLNAIEASADVTDTANVTSSGALMDSELTDLAGVKGVTISTLQAKPSEGAFANGDKTKLDAIEASADVTDTANVTSAGALMDSELAGLAAVKATTGTFLTADQSKLDGIESSATADQTDEEIQDVVGGMFSSNTETGITATYQDGDGTIDLVVGTLNQDTTGTASKATVTDSTANTNFPVVFHDESNALLDDTGALRYNPSTGELLVPKLTVAGTTTTVDTVTMEAANAIKFEGATADVNETILSIVDPTNDDNTQYLLNASGYIPLLAAVTTTAISSTPAEINLLDGSSANTVVNSKAVIYGSSGELAGTLSTAAQANVTSLGTLTTLTVDNVIINGTTIGHTSDTDLITLADGNVTIAGELDLTTLDVSGNADIDGTLETDALSINGTAVSSTAAELNVLDGYTGSVTELNYLDTLHATGVTNTEFDYLDGVTSNIQTQLDALPDTAGTNITLSGTTLNVDDAFLINSGNDTTSGTITAGGFTTTGNLTLGGHAVNDIDIGSEFVDADDHLMSAGAIKEKIENYGYSTTSGDITAVTAGTNCSGGGTSGSVTINVDDAFLKNDANDVMAGHLNMADDKELRLGNDSDLRLLSNNSNTFIDNYLGNMSIRQTVDDGDILFQSDDGSGGLATYLTLDGSATSVNIEQDVKLTATKKLYLDGGGDTYIYEAGADNVGVYVGGSHSLTFLESGGTNYTYVPDNAYLGAGSGIDFTIRHDTSHTYITNSTGDMNFVERDAGNINFRNNSGTSHLYIKTGGSVGIGTASPFAKLHISNGTSGVAALDFEDVSSCAIFIDAVQGTNYYQPLIGVGENATTFTAAISSYDAGSAAAQGLTFHTGDTNAITEHFRIAPNGTLTGTDTSIGSNSDLRLKENVKDFNSGLDIISKLQPKTFNFKNQTEHLAGTRRGFIAQEVKSVDNYWIDEIEIQESNPDYKYVKDTEGQSFVSKLNDKDAMYVSAIQELKREIDELKLKIGE